MTHFLVHGILSETSADDAFLYFFEGNYTYEQLEKLALEKVCKDERMNDTYWIEDDYPARVDIWDILKSDSPITFLTQTNKEEN